MASKLTRIALVLLMVTPASVGFAQTLQVGSTPTGVPFTFLETKTNSVQGVMVDLINAIAKDQGFTVEVQGMPFNTLIPSLQTSKIQIISAALGMTPERREVVDFTDPVYSYGEGVVVNEKDTKAYTSYEEMKGETVGVQVGTVYVDPMKKTGLFKEVKAYDSMADVIRDVGLNRIKAGFGDYPIVAYQISQGVHKDVRLVKGIPTIVNVNIGMAVKKGDTALLEKLNKSLSKFKNDGTLDMILVKWGLK